jgi:hypothetical protein
MSLWVLASDDEKFNSWICNGVFYNLVNPYVFGLSFPNYAKPLGMGILSLPFDKASF